MYFQITDITLDSKVNVTYINACTEILAGWFVQNAHIPGISFYVHLRNLLTHALLFWHFLKNLSFEFKNILEYIRTIFSDNAWLFSETVDSEYLKAYITVQ